MIRGRVVRVVVVVSMVSAALTVTANTAGAGSDAPQCRPGKTDGDLVFYNWSDYIPPKLIKKFERKFDVDVTEDFYPSNEEMLAKVSSGASGYDVIVPSDYMVSIMIEQDLLLLLDPDALPNLSNLSSDFDVVPYDPRHEYSVPYQWGTTGIAVDTEVVGDDFPESWALIFDEDVAKEYSGRISMLNDAREVLGAALKYLGYSVNTTRRAELNEAADLVRAATNRIAAYDSDTFEDLLVAGETSIAHGYSGDFFEAFDAASTDDFDAYEQFTYFIPEEGGVRWVDNMAILADAPHPCTAHAFINFILNARNGARLTNYTFFGSPNEASKRFIKAAILDDPSIYPPPEVTERLEFIADTGNFEPNYQDAFTRAKG